jgi:hypothetical protein
VPVYLCAYVERKRRPSVYKMPVQHKEKPKEPKSRHGALNYRLWKFFEKLRKPEIKFAVKVGVGSILLALPAFTETYGELYAHWRGEWALLSYFVVIANSVGATTSVGLWRYPPAFISDIELWAPPSGLWQQLSCNSLMMASDDRWNLSPANPYALSIIGALFSTLCFYLIANTTDWQPFGRFVLLTYNLVQPCPYILMIECSIRICADT